MAALVDLEYVKDVLSVTSSAEDTRLGHLVLAASAAVEKYCQRKFLAATYTEHYSGNNTQRLALRKRPVTAVASVQVDPAGYFGLRGGSFGATTTLVAGTDYTLDVDEGAATSSSGVLLRIGTVWPLVTRASFPTRVNTEVSPAFGNVKVVYTAGFAVVPDDVQYAVALVVQQMRITLKYGGMLGSEKIGDYAYRLADGLVRGRGRELADVRNVLASYRETGW